MVTRRRLLTTVAASGAVSLSGCVFDSADSYPVHLRVQNARAERFALEIVLEIDGGETLFEGEFDVPEPEGDRHIMRFDDVARVSDGERVRAQVHVDGDAHEVSQEVTCASGMPSNVFRFVIYPGENVQGGDGMALQALSDGRTEEEC